MGTVPQVRYRADNSDLLRKSGRRPRAGNSGGRGRRARSSVIPLLVTLILATGALVSAWRESDRSAGLDFYQFWFGAQIARESSTTNLYSSDTRIDSCEAFKRRAATESSAMRAAASARDAFEFFSTPFLYATFGVFPHDYDSALVAYRIALLAALVAGVLLASRAVRLSWPAALLLLAFVLLLFQPVKSELRVLNVNSLQLAAIAAAMWLERRDTRASSIGTGALLGLVVAFKPNVAPVVPLLLAYRFITRDRARLAVEAAGVGAGAFGAFLIGSVYFGSAAAWLPWRVAAAQLAAQALQLASGNIGPAAMLAGKLGAMTTPFIALVLLAAVIIALSRSRRPDEGTLVIGAGVAIYLLSATLVWFHYLILAIPLTAPPLADASKPRRGLAILRITIAGADFWTTLFHVSTLHGEAVIAIAGLLLLFALAVWRLEDPTEPIAHARPL